VYKNQRSCASSGRAAGHHAQRDDNPVRRAGSLHGSRQLQAPISNVDLDGVFHHPRVWRRRCDPKVRDGRYAPRRGRRRRAAGLEAARFLQGPEIEGVTVVEIMPRLLPRQLDETGSRMLQGMLEGPRSTVITGSQVASFLGDRKVRAVQLLDGRELPAETAV